MVNYSSQTHLYIEYHFGFLIARISGFFGSDFRDFSRRWISGRSPLKPMFLGILSDSGAFLVPILGPLFRSFFGGDFSVHFALHLAVDFGLSLAADCFLNNAEDVTAFILEIVFDVT